VLVLVDSLRVGIGWADDGPRSGYFPFYIGWRCWGQRLDGLQATACAGVCSEVFAERAQLPA
jgi:putative tricarboxylic transport membrane protein